MPSPAVAKTRTNPDSGPARPAPVSLMSLPRPALPALLAVALTAQAASSPSAPVTAPVTLPAFVVTATRAPQDPATLPLTVDVFTASALHDGPSLTLDDALRRSAAFSLFRRTGSLTANPTAQGASLRGIGPSAASRALVLLDGVPVVDPFFGSIAWSKLPSASLERIEVVRGGGSSAWGGTSLGGTIQLITAPLLPAPDSPPSGNPRTSGDASATWGDFNTRALDDAATFVTPSARDAWRIDAAAFATDGVRLVQNPGPIDRPADSASQRGQLTWQHRVGDSATLTATARAWHDERGNGTPYQENASDERFVSATLTARPANGPAWSCTLYAQDQDYSNTFSSVNAARTAETPASDQYAVPATAGGASAQLTWGDARDLASGTSSLTTVGLDARRVEGETREHFRYIGGTYTRNRLAGGTQTSAGLFANHSRALAPDLTASAGLRLDTTRNTDGFRHETVLATGVDELNQHYANREDRAFSPSLGLAWRATDTLTARAAAYSAYRTPTLNELYRPFRVGPVTTRANPALAPETLLGGELGLAWETPAHDAGLRATIFQNDLSDAVANVTLDATTREKRNLDSARVRGLELGGHWNPFAPLRLDADYLLNDARVVSGGPAAAALDGRRLAQVPRHNLTLGATWQAARALDFDLRAGWRSAQWEDDLNTLRLAPFTRLDLAAHYAFSPRWRLTLAVENLLDTDIETGRTATGVVSIAPPRWSRAELEFRW
ncbi:MAG: hypothetical protein RIQ79_1788 [Verrucomicrobiota bacterium]